MTVTPETPKPAIRIAVRDNEVVKAALRALGAGAETDFRAGIEKIVRAEVARIMQSDPCLSGCRPRRLDDEV